MTTENNQYAVFTAEQKKLITKCWNISYQDIAKSFEIVSQSDTLIGLQMPTPRLINNLPPRKVLKKFMKKFINGTSKGWPTLPVELSSFLLANQPPNYLYNYQVFWDKKDLTISVKANTTGNAYTASITKEFTFPRLNPRAIQAAYYKCGLSKTMIDAKLDAEKFILNFGYWNFDKQSNSSGYYNVFSDRQTVLDYVFGKQMEMYSKFMPYNVRKPSKKKKLPKTKGQYDNVVVLPAGSAGRVVAHRPLDVD